MALVLPALLLAACSSSSASPTGPCAARVGTYEETFSEQANGTCPALTPVVLVYPTPAGADSGASSCTGGSTVSTDECTVSIEESCPTTFTGGAVGQVRETGDVRWSEDGASASGTLELTLVNPDGSTSCVGTYDVSFQRK